MSVLSNQPPLADQLALAYEDLVAEIEATVAGTSVDVVVSDDDSAANAAKIGKPLKDLQAKIEKARKAEKDAFLKGGRAVDGFFAGIRAELDKLFAIIDGKINAYQQEKRRKALEAEKLQREAAVVFGGDKPEEAKPAETTRISAGDKVAVSGAVKWDYEITDVAALPRELLMPNDAAIKARVAGLKASCGDIEKASIPGVRIFERVTTAWR